MGTIKTTNIEPIADNGTVTLGSSGDTFTVPSGVTVNMSSATQTGVGGVNTPAFRATSSSGDTIPNQSYTKLTFDTEAFDTNNNFTSSRFTPTVAGKYVVTAQTRLNSDSDFNDNIIAIYKNGSISSSRQMSHLHYECNLVTGIIDMNGSSDYVEVYFFHNQGGNVATDGGTTLNFFEAYKLIT